MVCLVLYLAALAMGGAVVGGLTLEGWPHSPPTAEDYTSRPHGDFVWPLQVAITDFRWPLLVGQAILLMFEVRWAARRFSWANPWTWAVLAMVAQFVLYWVWCAPLDAIVLSWNANWPPPGGYAYAERLGNARLAELVALAVALLAALLGSIVEMRAAAAKPGKAASAA